MLLNLCKDRRELFQRWLNEGQNLDSTETSLFMSKERAAEEMTRREHVLQICAGIMIFEPAGMCPGKKSSRSCGKDMPSWILMLQMMLRAQDIGRAPVARQRSQPRSVKLAP